jgi:hypothetical protein
MSQYCRSKLFKLRLRRRDTGEEHDRIIYARCEAEAKDRAPVVARRSLKVMADRQYARFDVLTCDAQ